MEDNGTLQKIFFKGSDNEHFEMGLPVRNSIQVSETGQFNERIVAITIRKRSHFKAMLTTQGRNFFRNVKLQCLLTVINVHAPHVGITQSNDKKKQNLMNSINYRLSQNTMGDVIYLGDFDAKLSKRNHIDIAVASHARGRKNDNGDYLHDFVSENRYIATNNFFKHKGCHNHL